MVNVFLRYPFGFPDLKRAMGFGRNVIATMNPKRNPMQANATTHPVMSPMTIKKMQVSMVVVTTILKSSRKVRPLYAGKS